MPTPGEHKTVQARMLEYAEAIRLRQGHDGHVGWKLASREKAKLRRGVRMVHAEERTVKFRSLVFEKILCANVQESSLRFSDSEDALNESIWLQVAAKLRAFRAESSPMKGRPKMVNRSV